MSRYLLHHRHEPFECGVAFASFKGSDSPLRRLTALASCVAGHATSEAAALCLLPSYVAQRTTATRISEVEIP